MDNWALKYFAAQSYIDLYAKTKDLTYLSKAYQIAKNNVNLLVIEQKKTNKTYLNDVEILKISDADTELMTKEEIKAQQKNLDKYNKSLKEKRETELPSLYEPLILNCDLLFSLADELNISTSEEKEKTIKDFKLKKVERKGENTTSFFAYYESKELSSYKWSKNDKIYISISNGGNFDDLIFQFEVEEINKGAWNFIKGIFGEDKVIFKCTTN